MKHKRALIFLAFFGLFSSSLIAEEADSNFETIFDGVSFKGWLKAEENPDTWKIEDNAFVTRGPRSHLFFDTKGKPLKNFHLKMDVMTEPNSNGGIFFHTKYQPEGWPYFGFESQVNVSQRDWRKTGSIYAVADVGYTPTKDNKWWSQEIIVEGKKVTVKVDGVVVVEYNQPPGAVAGDRFKRVFNQGTIALQAHDPGSVVHYRNIQLKRLSD